MTVGREGLPQLIGEARIIPVITIEAIETAVPLARALVAGGLRVLEITLRTPVALQAIRNIAAEVEGAVLGAGTVLTPEQLAAAGAAGARFAVSPGATPALIAAARTQPLAFLPAAATPSEAMALLEQGYTRQKFFPAEPYGGLATLKALAAPLPMVHFCPTGGIDARAAPRYLALGNVFAIGGSWMLPKDRIAASDWLGIRDLAMAASALAGEGSL